VESTASPVARLEHSKYWAFISYSHKDTIHAEWLHRAIEAYRIPSRLVGKPGRDGDVPKRLFPLFRDQDELSAAASLPQQIHDALYSSRTMIVVCSPAAVRSKWVEEEVRAYKRLGRADRVLCLVASGEPDVSPGKEPAEAECFPTAVRYVVDGGGNVTDERAEPLAADIRRHSERGNALLRIVAGMTGLSFDELKQRERQRRLRRTILGASIAAGLACLVGGVLYLQELRRTYEATAQSIAAYTNLGQRELADGHDQRAAAALGEAYRLGAPDARLRLLMAQSLQSIRLREPALARGEGTWLNVVLDGKGARLVAIGRTSPPVLWDVATGNVVAELAGHDGRVNVARFTPDDSQLVTAGDDHFVRIWQSSDGRPLGSYKLHDTVLTEIVLSTNGHAMVSIGADATAFLWDLEARSGQPLPAYSGPGGLPARFDGTGAHFAATDVGNTILQVWDLTRPQSPIRIRLAQEIRYFEFNPNGESVLVADATGAVRSFRSDTGAPLEASVQPTFWTDAGLPVHIGFLADGRRLDLVGSRGIVQLWDLATATKLRESRIDLDQVRLVDAREGNVVLASGGNDPHLSVVDVESGTHVTIDLDGEPATGAAVSVGRKVLFGAVGGTVVKWDLSRRPENVSLPTRGRRVNGVDISPDGKQVVTGDSEGAVTVWDPASGAPIATLGEQNSDIVDARFFAYGLRIVTRSANGDVTKWRGTDHSKLSAIPGSLGIKYLAVAESWPPTMAIGFTVDLATSVEGRDLLWLQAHVSPITALVLSENGQLLAAGHEDGVVKIWNVGQARPLVTAWGHRGAVKSLAFSPDASRLVTAGADSFAIVWSVSDGSEVARLVGHVGPIAAARFSPDGRRVATAGDDRTAKVWELPSGRVAATLEGHAAAVRDARYNRDGSLIATSGADGLVNVWDASTGRLVRSLPHEGEILALNFSQDQPLLVAGSNGGGVAKVWDLRAETRAAGELERLLRAGSPWRMRNGVLSRGDDAAGSASRASASSGGLSASAATTLQQQDAPEDAIRAFLTALERGDTDRVRELVDANGRPAANSVLDATADQLRGDVAALFKGARITSTTFRDDRLAAMTLLDTQSMRIAVWTEKAGGLWKLVDFKGASPPK
jgi:WD40 repeat protein